ncbi:hypothetical protein D3C71_1478160 [compost metagenome]
MHAGCAGAAVRGLPRSGRGVLAGCGRRGIVRVPDRSASAGCRGLPVAWPARPRCTGLAGHCSGAAALGRWHGLQHGRRAGGWAGRHHPARQPAAVCAVRCAAGVHPGPRPSRTLDHQPDRRRDGGPAGCVVLRAYPVLRRPHRYRRPGDGAHAAHVRHPEPVHRRFRRGALGRRRCA